MEEPARILVIGAGSRGHAYANAITKHSCGRGMIVGVAEPLPYKRREFQRRFAIADSLVFSSWTDVLAAAEDVKKKLDGICVCTLDETHAEIVLALRPLNLHVLCEKPLALTLADCMAMQASITAEPPVLLAIGHVLRYSPHNMLLHKLLVEDGAVGEVVNINHTEPVGYWHFAHSYVRGNWRNGAPSLLTKCCHDIDILLWLTAPHTPTSVSSHGALVHYRRANKPLLAGSSTNCFACPVEPECIYSAKRIYIDSLRRNRNTGWPNTIVAPEIEDCVDIADAAKILEQRLEGDGQYGRCVYEAGNDVVDNQVVVLSWDDSDDNGPRHGAKTATLTMIAHTKRICERQTKVYGTLGELTADSNTISVFDFPTGQTKVYTPDQYQDSHHGGGDIGLSLAFVDAIIAVKNGEATVEEAQRKYIKCTPEEAVRAHEVVFWAEQARLQKRVIPWSEWVKDQQ